MPRTKYLFFELPRKELSGAKGGFAPGEDKMSLLCMTEEMEQSHLWLWIMGASWSTVDSCTSSTLRTRSILWDTSSDVNTWMATFLGSRLRRWYLRKWPDYRGGRISGVLISSLYASNIIEMNPLIIESYFKVQSTGVQTRGSYII